MEIIPFLERAYHDPIEVGLAQWFALLNRLQRCSILKDRPLRIITRALKLITTAAGPKNGQACDKEKRTIHMEVGVCPES